MSSSVVILIPAYRPTDNLAQFIKELSAAGLNHIVVVDDGSPAADSQIFSAVQALPSVNYLHHSSNRGKGAALKTGFQFITQTYPDAVGVVTADADGQHAVSDVVEIVNRLSQDPSAMILGVRNFAGSLPWRSWFGNTLTRQIFGWLTGQQLSDTQTGLRGLPISWLPWLATLPGDRYEYEINMLMEAKRRGLFIAEEPIATIYMAGNASSHFNPIGDSLKIYWVLLRYIMSSLITAATDILLFAGLMHWWGNVTLSILVSRWIVGAGVNFTLNRSLVFKEGSGVMWIALLRYYLVISVLGLIASSLVSWLSVSANLPVIYAKIIVEIILFPVGFIWQKRWVFRSSS